ncbi:PQQ-binding-like beta-propeller repeat protein [Leeuwenhoekiella marinoflava]|uniref:outer membrane protein assembly factor BamB family protein n=1 Tax=Leeuwenhoekiella marinoflava TaxID=988 RepID=UPI0030015277
MKNFHLNCILLISIVIQISCSPEEKLPENKAPGVFQIDDIQFDGLDVFIDWSDSTDPDEDIVYYSLYLNDIKTYEGEISESTLRVEYNKLYICKLIATDRNGGVQETTFNFNSPNSKILFYQTGNHIIHAYDLIENKKLWEAEGGLLSSFCIVDDKIYTGSDKIQGLDLLTGESKWTSMSLNYYDRYRDIIADQKHIYAFTIDDDLYCIDVLTGDKVWWRSFIDYEGPMGIDESKVYIANRNNYDLFAIDKETGESLWTYESFDRPYSYEIESNPLIVDDVLYVCDNYYYLKAFDKNTGSLKWQIRLDTSIYASPTTYNDRIIVATNQSIYCINKKGIIEWSKQVPSGYNFQTSPIVDGDKIFTPLTGNGSGKFNCLDARSGNQIWSFACGQNPSSPVVFEDQVFFGDWDNKMYSLNTITGTVNFELNTESYVSGSATVVEGLGGKIYYPSVSALKN